MFCSNCGTQSTGNFCPRCGLPMTGVKSGSFTPSVVVQTPPTQPSQQNVVYVPVPQAQKRGSNPLGIAAFVVSLLTYLYSAALHFTGNRWILAGLVAIQVLLIVFAFRTAKQHNLSRGMTIAALVFCCINAYFLLVMFVFMEDFAQNWSEQSTLFEQTRIRMMRL